MDKKTGNTITKLWIIVATALSFELAIATACSRHVATSQALSSTKRWSRPQRAGLLYSLNPAAAQRRRYMASGFKMKNATASCLFLTGSLLMVTPSVMCQHEKKLTRRQAGEAGEVPETFPSGM